MSRHVVYSRLRVSSVICAGAFSFMAAVAVAHADETLTQDAKQAGHATGEAVHNIAQGAKKTGLAIAHDAVKVGKAIGDAAKEGGKEFKHAVSGGGSSQQSSPQK